MANMKTKINKSKKHNTSDVVWINVPVSKHTANALKKLATMNDRPLLRQAKWILDKFVEGK